MRVIQKALTFDDVLLLPAHSRVLPREIRVDLPPQCVQEQRILARSLRHDALRETLLAQEQAE